MWRKWLEKNKQKNTRTSQTDYSLHLQLHRVGKTQYLCKKLNFSKIQETLKSSQNRVALLQFCMGLLKGSVCR